MSETTEPTQLERLADVKQNTSENAGISRKQYAELVLMMLDGAQFPGSEAEKVVELKQITRQLGRTDPWPSEF